MIDREVPKEWEARLREVSPISEVVSWLSLRFHPDFERWVLYECVPIRFIYDNALIEDLAQGDTTADDVLVSAYQQQMFKKYRVHARPCWIIQGTKGGHQVDYDDATKELMRASGLPTEAPKPGTLPYAPFDERVATQLTRMSKLVKVKNDLAEFKKTYGSVEGNKLKYRDNLQEARKQYVAYLNEQFSEPAEDFIKAERLGEMDTHKRVETDFVKADEAIDEKYIQTGRF